MKKFAILIAGLMALICATPQTAQAQSGCAAIVYGAVLTPAQWNACFAAKNDVLNYTPVNKAGDTMFGRLVMNPSSTARAGLNVAPGVAPTSPVDGDTWTTTAGLYVRINGVTVGPLAGGGGTVTSVSGTANEISVATGTTTPVISIPTAVTFTGKTITGGTYASPSLTSPTITGAPTAVGATWTDLGAVTTADINGGTMDGTVIGGAAAAAVTSTTLTATGAVALSPASANVVLSPTGTGVVTINPATAGAVDNVVIGGITPAAITSTTLTATAAVALSPANANVVISPTGTGLVTINPATAGTLDNLAVGGSTPLAGTFTLATANRFVPNNATIPTNGLYLPGTNKIGWSTNSTAAAVIDASQNMTLGATTQILGGPSSSATYGLQIARSGANQEIGLMRFVDGSGGAQMNFMHSRSGTIGTNTVLQSGDTIGTITFQGADGTNYPNAATILASVDGTPGLADMPGRLTFSTTADGTSSPTEHMRIASTGLISLPTLTTDATLTTRTVCQNTADNTLHFGSGVIGICLGTSSARYKDVKGAVPDGLEAVLRWEPVVYRYNALSNMDRSHDLYGFTAEQVLDITPDLVGLDKDGRANTIDMVGMIPVLVRAIQEQQAQIASMKERVH